MTRYQPADSSLSPRRGQSPAQGLEIIRGLTGIGFVGFDVVEVIPG